MTNFKTPATAPKYSLLSMALAAAMIATPAFAQTTAPTKDEPTTTTTPEANKPTNVGTVQVRGASDLDERKNESVSKIIINREDFLKQGDTSIMDVLKRLPGISTGGRGAALACADWVADIRRFWWMVRRKAQASSWRKLHRT